jgi:hypothetical protein
MVKMAEANWELDHFSMMCPPYASAVGKIVSDAVAAAVQKAD